MASIATTQTSSARSTTTSLEANVVPAKFSINHAISVPIVSVPTTATTYGSISLGSLASAVADVYVQVRPLARGWRAFPAIAASLDDGVAGSAQAASAATRATPPR